MKSLSSLSLSSCEIHSSSHQWPFTELAQVDPWLSCTGEPSTTDIIPDVVSSVLSRKNCSACWQCFFYFYPSADPVTADLQPWPTKQASRCSQECTCSSFYANDPSTAHKCRHVKKTPKTTFLQLLGHVTTYRFFLTQCILDIHPSQSFGKTKIYPFIFQEFWEIVFQCQRHVLLKFWSRQRRQQLHILFYNGNLILQCLFSVK